MRRLLLSCALIVGLAGCGGGSSPVPGGVAPSGPFLAFTTATYAPLYGRLDLATQVGTIASGPGHTAFQSVRATAHDPVSDTLYGIDGGMDWLVAIDRVAGTFTPVGPLGFHGVESLAYDAGAGTLLAVDNATSQLLTIDPATGRATVVPTPGVNLALGMAIHPTTGVIYVSLGTHVATLDRTTGFLTSLPGPLGYGTLRGLALDPVTGTLFGLDRDTRRLLTIDTTTGVASDVGAIGAFTCHALAYDASSGALWTCDAIGRRGLVRLDRLTGAGTRVGYPDPGIVIGLAHVGASDTLYACSYNLPYLFTIDRVTGISRLVGPFGIEGVGSLAYDPTADRFFALDAINSRLLVIDRGTAEASVVAPLSASGLGGLAFDPVTSTLYGTDATGAGGLYRINTVTGAASLIGSPAVRVAVPSLAFDATTSTLYGHTGPGGQVIRIDPATGAHTYLGPHGADALGGIAFDGTRNQLRGASPYGLLTLDTSSGAATGYLAMAWPCIEGLAYDSTRSRLLGITGCSDTLVEVDARTGGARFVASLPSGIVRSLAYEPVGDRLYGVDVVLDELWRIDPVTGSTTVVGGLARRGIEGLAIDPVSGALFGCVDNDILLIEPTTATALPWMTLPGAIYLRDIAYDPDAALLYTTDALGQLFTVDPTTLVVTLAGTLDQPLTALCWHPALGP